MSSANTNLTHVSPLNLTRVPPFLGMYTSASLRPGFAQNYLTGLASQPRVSPLTLLVSPGSRQSPQLDSTINFTVKAKIPQPTHIIFHRQFRINDTVIMVVYLVSPLTNYQPSVRDS